jgi:hypothetical protein
MKSAIEVSFSDLGQVHDAHEDRHPQREHQDRADVDRRELKPARGSQADAAEIGP